MASGDNTDAVIGFVKMLLKQVLPQSGETRELGEKESQSARDWIEKTLADKRRKDALAALGELVLAAVLEDRLSVEEIPGMAAAIARVDRTDNSPKEPKSDAPPSFETWVPEKEDDESPSASPAPGRRDTIVDPELAQKISQTTAETKKSDC